MHSKGKTFLMVVALLVVFAVVLMVAAPDCAYAKGAQKSGGSSKSGGDSGRSESSSNSSDSNNSSSSNSSSSNHESSSPPPQSNPEPSRPPEPAPDHSSSPTVTNRTDRTDRTNDDITVHAPERLKGRTSSPRQDVKVELPSVQLRNQEVRGVDAKASFRKDYEDLGQVWRQRSERRTPPPARSQDNHGDHNTHIEINNYYNNFPGYYPYYAYDYRPGYAYPSIYCYYYGWFPPFIQGVRVIYISQHHGMHYTYIDLPNVVIINDSNPYYDDDRYYLEDRNNDSLSSALADIRKAWTYSDVDRLMRHVRRDSRIDVFLRDEYSYSLDWRDYSEMTRDAMDNIDTSDFEFYRVRQRDNREVVAYGKHTYYDEDDNKRNDDYYYSRSVRNQKTVYVTYTLERIGSEWYITETGTSPNKLY